MSERANGQIIYRAFQLKNDYDNSGNLSAQWDRFGKPTTHTYSPTGKPLVTTFADKETVTLNYDSRDWLMSTLDASSPPGRILRQTTRQEYYADGREKKTVDPLTRDRVIQTYDEDGRPYETSTPMPNGTAATATSSVEYTPRGDVWKAHDALTRITEFAYDANGNLTDRWNRRAGEDQGHWQFWNDYDNRLGATTSPTFRFTQNAYEGRRKGPGAEKGAGGGERGRRAEKGAARRKGPGRAEKGAGPRGERGRVFHVAGFQKFDFTAGRFQN